MIKFIRHLIVYSCLLLPFFATAQTDVELQLKTHVTYLADDKLEGRATGSIGEQLASKYIQSEFEQLRLQPLGDDGSYFQQFSFRAGKQAGDSNFLITDNRKYSYPQIIPSIYSANGYITGKAIWAGYGIASTALNYDDYKNIDATNKILLIDLSIPGGYNPHSKFYEFYDERLKIKTAYEHGAAGVIFFTKDSLIDVPEADFSLNITAEDIPALFIPLSSSAASLLKDLTTDVNLCVELNKVEKTGRNVLGFIDNGAQTTVVIGAHYDHLGMGTSGGSLYRGTPAIHNGADDNASGVSLIIELAEKLASSPFKSNNYLFAAFSGEELGLFGSMALAESDIIKKMNVNYMLNFDMVGKLDSSKTLIINGTGSSPAWNIVNEVSVEGINVKCIESGVGPSDHTSFYLKDIPVLHFFTGSHSDYHKPTDDADKLNYAGIESILDFVYAVIDSINDDGKIRFTETQQDSSENIPKFTVTLGVVPDYGFSGVGMRIDGVAEGRPASIAGLIDGDTVIKLGDYDVKDMMSYMKGLSKFKKGDATTVAVMRNNKTMIFTIQF